MIDPLSATLWTARAAAGLYAAFLLQGAAVPPSRRTPTTGRGLWTAACAATLLHIATAVAWFHGGSQAAAWEHTARRTAETVGVATGFGLVVNYAFAVLWTIDVVRRWCAPATAVPAASGYRRFVRASAAFLFFNAAVVFASGPMRRGAIAVFSATAAAYGVRRFVDRAERPASGLGPTS